MSNFAFLNKKWPTISKLGTQAKNYLHIDNNALILKLCMFEEKNNELCIGSVRHLSR